MCNVSLRIYPRPLKLHRTRYQMTIDPVGLDHRLYCRTLSPLIISILSTVLVAAGDQRYHGRTSTGLQRRERRRRGKVRNQPKVSIRYHTLKYVSLLYNCCCLACQRGWPYLSLQSFNLYVLSASLLSLPCNLMIIYTRFVTLDKCDYVVAARYRDYDQHSTRASKVVQDILATREKWQTVRFHCTCVG